MEVNVKSSQELENIEITQQMDLISNHITHTNEIRITIQSDIDSFNILYSECTKCSRKFLVKYKLLICILITIFTFQNIYNI